MPKCIGSKLSWVRCVCRPGQPLSSMGLLQRRRLEEPEKCFSKKRGTRKFVKACSAEQSEHSACLKNTNPICRGLWQLSSDYFSPENFFSGCFRFFRYLSVLFKSGRINLLVFQRTLCVMIGCHLTRRSGEKKTIGRQKTSR